MSKPNYHPVAVVLITYFDHKSEGKVPRSKVQNFISISTSKQNDLDRHRYAPISKIWKE